MTNWRKLLIVTGLSMVVSGLGTIYVGSLNPSLSDRQYANYAVYRASKDPVKTAALVPFRDVIGYARPSQSQVIPDPETVRLIVVEAPALSERRLNADIRPFIEAVCNETALAARFVRFGDRFGFQIQPSFRKAVSEYEENPYFIHDAKAFFHGLTGECANSVMAMIGGGLGFATRLGSVATLTQQVAYFASGDPRANVIEAGFGMIGSFGGLSRTFIGKNAAEGLEFAGHAKSAHSILDSWNNARHWSAVYRLGLVTSQSTHHPGTLLHLPAHLDLLGANTSASTAGHFIPKLLGDVLPKADRIFTEARRSGVNSGRIFDLFIEEDVEVAWVLLSNMAKHRDMASALALRDEFRSLEVDAGHQAEDAIPILPFMHYTKIRSLEALRAQEFRDPVKVFGWCVFFFGAGVFIVGLFTTPNFEKLSVNYPNF